MTRGWNGIPRRRTVPAGVFYKTENPIELYLRSRLTTKTSRVNRDEAPVMGSKSKRANRYASCQYLDEFTVGANLAFMKSETELTPPNIATRLTWTVTMA